MNEKLVVGIIGSGAMGSGIAQVAASAGHDVWVYDSSTAAIDKAQVSLVGTFQKLVEKQKLADTIAKEILSRIQFTESLTDFADCGLVIEAIVENLEIKQKVFIAIEKIVSDDCLLASNTSSLSVTAIAGACVIPERVLGIHFFNPAPLMPLVEIIPALTTDAVNCTTARNIIDSWNKTTVIAKDTPGFIVNRVARPFYGEAIRIYEEQLADFSTIDWAMKEVGGFRMGPFELMDLIGNDVNYAVTNAIWHQLFFDPRYKPSLTQKKLNEAKFLGRKSGKGYFNYESGTVNPEPVRDKEKAHYIYNRILCMLINEAADALYLGIAKREDIDLAMTKGVNYPKGLLKWADEIGIGRVLSSLEELLKIYNEERYRPSPLLRIMADSNQKFY